MGRRRFHAAFILYKTLGYPELGYYIMLPMLNWVMAKKQLLNLNYLLKQVFRHLYLLCWEIYVGIKVHRTIIPVPFIRENAV